MLINMVAADITKWCAWGHVVVRSIHGWNNQGTSVYIQLFQTPTVAASQVPACKSIVATANNGFMYTFGPQGIELTELLVALSTTETSYTAVAASGGLDMTLDVDTQFACDGTEVIVGDLTTGVVAAQQVWSEATGLAAPKRLLRVDFKNNAASLLYNVVYAVDSPQPTTPVSKVTTYFPCPASVTTSAFFGDAQGGFRPFQQDANYTQHNGCSIMPSDVLTPGSLWGGTAPNIRSIYKPL